MVFCCLTMPLIAITFFNCLIAPVITYFCQNCRIYCALNYSRHSGFPSWRLWCHHRSYPVQQCCVSILNVSLLAPCGARYHWKCDLSLFSPFLLTKHEEVSIVTELVYDSKTKLGCTPVWKMQLLYSSCEVALFTRSTLRLCYCLPWSLIAFQVQCKLFIWPVKS